MIVDNSISCFRKGVEGLAEAYDSGIVKVINPFADFASGIALYRDDHAVIDVHDDADMAHGDAACGVAPPEVHIVAGLGEIVPLYGGQASVETLERGVFAHHSLFVIRVLILFLF